jgi:hypothetical protein
MSNPDEGDPNAAPNLRDLSSPMLMEEISRRLVLLKTPINIGSLIASGAISKAGSWFKLLAWSKVPEHARLQVSELKSDGGQSYIRFRRQRAPRGEKKGRSKKRGR